MTFLQLPPKETQQDLSIEFLEAVTWANFMTARLSYGVSVPEAAKQADRALKEFRDRFAAPEDRSSDATDR